ncbi:right-handed parallel beta-helix repeat-containing protein, partial [Sabulibacter ruber]
TGSSGNRIGGNRFVNVGNGLRLSGSSNNVIDGNLMEHLAGSGMDLSDRSNGNRIGHNLIQGIGEIRKYVGGIMANGVHDNLLSQNEI